jgi:hypothetical protein
MLERHTALALHPDKLGDAVNGYVEQYTETMKELSEKNKDFVSEMEEFEFNRMNGISNKNNEIKANKIVDDEIQSSNEERVFNDDNNPFKEDNNFEKAQPIGLDDSMASEEEMNLNF